MFRRDLCTLVCWLFWATLTNVVCDLYIRIHDTINVIDRESRLYTSLQDETTTRCVSESFNKTCWKESSTACALLSPLVPTIVAFFVHVYDIANSEFQFEFTIWRVWYDASKSVDTLPVDKIIFLHKIIWKILWIKG